MQSVQEYIRKSDELNVIILIDECFASKEWKIGITYYLIKFGNSQMGDNKLTALNIFAKYFRELMGESIEILSDLAVVYTSEPAFKGEYMQVCNRLGQLMGRK